MKNIALTGLLILLTLRTMAQELKLFEKFSKSYTYTNTMDIEAADLDQDGDLDLVLAMEFSENILLFNDSTRGFRIHQNQLLPENKFNQFTGHDSEDIAIKDFDQDGDLDLLFVSEDSPLHELYINKGDCDYKLATYRFPKSIANAVAVLDLNGDHFPDVIIGNNGQNHAYLNKRDTTFEDVTSSYLPQNTDATQDLKLADIDKDGDLDLIEGIEDGGNNIYLNENGKFVEANDRLPNFGVKLETRKVSLGDVNQDGFVDLYYCNVMWKPGANPQDRLLINNGKGYFKDVTATHLPSDFNPTLDANIIDFNGDGAPDIMTVGNAEVGKNYKLYLNDGNGKFKDATATLPKIEFSMGISLYTADFNQDGILDIYIGSFMSGDKIFMSTVE